MSRFVKIGFLGLVAWCFVAASVLAQGGSSVYTFLDLPMSARLNALGGTNVSTRSNDISLALCNPALLNEETDKRLQLNYAYYLQGVNIASALYGHNYKENRFAVGIHYLDYGSMAYADEVGNLTGGTFSARDVSINLMYARQLGPYFSVGVTLKPIYSNYESYNSFALAADVGGYFQTKDSTFQMGLSLVNMGWQLWGFYSEESGQHRERLPLSLQFGLNYRFKHAPIRVGMTVHNIQRWNLGYANSRGETYTVTSKKDYTTEEWEIMKKNGAVMWYDMLFRHTIFFVDIVPKSEKFYVTLSYNHRRRMEMQLQDQRSLAGFALGAGLNLKKVQLGVALTQYQKGQFVYQATLGLDINELK